LLSLDGLGKKALAAAKLPSQSLSGDS
jgi:hypothetical protein